MTDIIRFRDSELVIALVGAVGTDLRKVITPLQERLRLYKYRSEEIRISKEVIKPLFTEEEPDSAFERISSYMNKGNITRSSTQNKAVLANGASAMIYKRRKNNFNNAAIGKMAFIINQLKTPEEIKRLREIYQTGFYCISIHTSKERRLASLIRKPMTPSQAEELIQRDEDESEDYGQKTRDAFHLSDFFISDDGHEDKITNSIARIVDIIFGAPFKTPTFDEFSMFMAFSSALRSGDLSRQVGAVITSKNCIISTGANDVPKANGGVYWPEIDKNGQVIDSMDGRDFMIGHDSNSKEKQEIIVDIIGKLGNGFNETQITEIRKILNKSKIRDITEYGRVVHAEMDAILACARNGTSIIGATLYCTTFPCHNCAKHIVASGIKRVVYVEPYPKSKAINFHKDSISENSADGEEKVVFEPFIGVGPRRFFDLFSMHISDGQPVQRKNPDGTAVTWPGDEAPTLRMQMQPFSYIEKETIAANEFKLTIAKLSQGGQDE
ncbi:anti-phage dCTP deaminase [Chromobacterium haemolyticum]|uniref:anti-phage dCTP deaminase n=1 Tax=Chromobacterium haemolyticum TaxID=394935 RepID=UPI0021177A70|nr:anti-phage dCTP deaminase [Chromobacterium haemolyticum]